MTALLNCGHAAMPSGISAGYGVRDGYTMCLSCCYTDTAVEMLWAARAFVYVSGSRVTDWTGGHLGRVTRHNANDRQVFVQVTDLYGKRWHGIGPAQNGNYVRLRRSK